MKIAKFQNNTKSVLVFSMWKRKSYSIFQTISRVVVISVLAVNYLYAVPVEGIENNEQDTTKTTLEYELDEIEVSAQRSPALYSQVARVVTVINQKEIAAAPAKNIQELLEYVAGVDIRQRGAEGVQADISIRGGTFDQTLILLNGVNITDPQTGHHNLNIPVPYNQIERIEILEGPAARVYGPNAFAGAVNIITRLDNQNSFNGNITSGSFKYFDTNVSGSFVTNNLNHSLSMYLKGSDGYIANTDFEEKGIFYSNQFNGNAGKLNFQTGFSDKGFGANSFYTPKYPNQYENVQTLLTSLKWESFSRIHLTPLIYWRRHQDRFELFRDNPPAWYTSHNYHLTNTFGGNLNSWVQWKYGKTAVGIEYRSENILSNVLGEPLDEPVEVPGGNAFYTKSLSRSTFSGFLEHAYHAENWSVSAGVMGNFITESGRGLNLFPGVEASYQINSSFKLFGNFNTSLRMPTFTDLYYAGPTNIGNPDLKPELTNAIESGIALNSGKLQGRLVAFYREGNNVIDWVRMSDSEKWQPQNITSLTSYGTEIQVHSDLKQVLGPIWPDKVAVNWLFMNISKNKSDFISYYVLDNLRNKLNFSMNKEFGKYLLLDIRTTYQQREGTYTSFGDGVWGEEVGFEPFWIFDSKLTCQLKYCSIFVSVNNIFNTTYYDVGNVVQPGRLLKLGISVNANFD